MKFRKWKLVKGLVKWNAIIVLTVVLANLVNHVYNVPHQAPIIEPPSIVDRIQESLPSVVHLSVETDEGIGQGSGFAIAPDLIQTARHVILGGTKFTITTHEGYVMEATRVAVSKEHDVAWIKLDEIPRWDSTGELVLKPVRFGLMKNMKLGETVYSIGSTYGKVHMNAVAIGNLQTLAVNGGDWKRPDWLGWSNLFTNTAEGGGGNSGCTLFNEHGQVIGIWVGSRQPNVHFTIPADLFLRDLRVIYSLFYIDKYEMINSLERLEPWSRY
jgi:S1-C subfamily serine protease